MGSLHSRSIRAALATSFVAVISFTAGAGLAEDRELRVMSFNVRFALDKPHEAAAENNWNDVDHPRRERAIRVIRDFDPDVLGVQEARQRQVNDLQEALPKLEFYGVGRDDGVTAGEFVGIFYRAERFSRTDAGTFWLSDQPETPGTSFYTVPDAVPRIASWVRLRDKQTGQEMLVLNAHFDHISKAARRKSAILIRERLSKLAEGLPTIVLGDLNTPEESAPLRTFLSEADSDRQLFDSYRSLHPQRSPEESTFNHWKGTTAGSRIDFILHTAEFVPKSAEIVRTNYENLWPSDHYPVTATFGLDAK